MPNCSLSPAARRRQRTTPWIAGPLSTIAASAARCSAFNLRTRGLAVLQALRSFRVEAKNPVPDDLQAYSRKAGRIRTAMTIVDHRKRKQATALRTVPAPLRNTTKASRIKISTQRKCSSHNNPPIQGSHLESEIGPAGNPPHESVATASGMSLIWRDVLSS